MEQIKAKHTVGDPIHVKLFYADDRARFTHYGIVTGVRIQKGTIFPDQVEYDVELEKAEGPNIMIQNLPKGFVLAGGPPVDEEEDGSHLSELGDILKPE